jgi:hypothetical protein
MCFTTPLNPSTRIRIGVVDSTLALQLALDLAMHGMPTHHATRPTTGHACELNQHALDMHACMQLDLYNLSLTTQTRLST